VTYRTTEAPLEPTLANDWYVVAETSSVGAKARRTTLFGEHFNVCRSHGGAIEVTRADGTPAPVTERYGFVWTSPGTPVGDVLDIPEAREVDRHVLAGGSFGVHVSGLRAVENFLDMGHFPFVHTDFLGIEPHTEVKPYAVTDDDGTLVASECEFFQPVASPTANGGIMVDYVYKVFQPFIVALYKTNPGYASKRDFIALFIQPTGEEHCIVHTFLAYLRKDIDAPTVRWFMQLIFAQDKPILENQQPKRLPLDPRSETPVRADAASVAYRRWLRERGVRYGAIAIDA
jgi:phenylpropionate dioxygenase-like ring-hydroxylating dioxygenase large terminal subunit